jgi:lipoyl-dependent peroxiredoxin
MTKIEKVIYTAKAHTTGGRDNGASRTSDGRLDVQLSGPGTPGAGTNPEQLFAVGWSACFLSAMKIVAQRKRVQLPAGIAIDAEVDVGLADGGAYGIAARFSVKLPGMDPQAARLLVDETHRVCPYSRATQGNIEVATTVGTSEPQAAHV